jgi:hypothetical protein
MMRSPCSTARVIPQLAVIHISLTIARRYGRRTVAGLQFVFAVNSPNLTIGGHVILRLHQLP